MAPNPPLCRSDYYADTNHVQHRNDRVCRCGLLRGHPGDHDEMIDGESGVVTWPRREKAADLTGLPAEQALNLGALTAELITEAEARGYRRAIDALRDDKAVGAWGLGAVDGVIPPRDDWRFAALAADYLEASTHTAIRSGESAE